jgi:hypothetical protein
MYRLLLGLAPALLLTLAACGGGSETVATDTTTTAATAAPTGDGATAEPTGGETATAAPNDGSTSMPDLPAGTVAVSEYHIFPPTDDQSSILFTADITQTIPDGAKTYWYTYVGGQWQQLQEAYISGIRTKTAQGSFDVTPKNLIVLAVTS